VPVVVPTPPSCIYCAHDLTHEVTPAQPVAHERWFECRLCHRRFAVKFTLFPVPTPASEAR
jgi:hypothetical protein